MSIEFVLLSEHPEHADVCAAWSFGLWGSQSSSTLARAVAKFTPHEDTDADDASLETVVAVKHGRAIGMASLWPSDLPDRPDLSPWMAAMFVHEEHRDLGLATRLGREVEDLARARGVGTLYLVTEHAELLYLKSGWRVVDRVTTVLGPAALMTKTL
ncbi:Acetyltransferase (GNAT) family protein [Sanguibacter gelidistatuariae]|uniref:Acetyltransferase (GNAT) family protein n=1 Tax=Sanguibacter gelidistatuariae TaxID=1814289 RepID=A0A1G6H3I1_9MICO|nr:GNAT family N-acetyltransferase [Sanguibacter gelidistatuariae]SDB87986.1 Acetyltransferase (GNAT) family protein [Sanguibacter gelidistatuariae]